MARQIKPKEDHHRFAGFADAFRGGVFEMHLVRGRSRGRGAYLWVGPQIGGSGISTYSGPKFLRALAKAILKEVGND